MNQEGERFDAREISSQKEPKLTEISDGLGKEETDYALSVIDYKTRGEALPALRGAQIFFELGILLDEIREEDPSRADTLTREIRSKLATIEHGLVPKLKPFTSPFDK